MQYRRLGRSGLQVSELSLGSWVTYHNQVDTKAATKMLATAMDASHYRFQALLYSIATDRYLRQRIGRSYDRSACLGECVYLFVRSAGIAQDAGIWRHRFDDALLYAVDDVLAGGQAGAEAA